ncbi:MAG: AMP-binding protein [Clostridiales bacterium]|jgi:fatty-acyl-CoA synthase|nr:AMP-binding protein [Clostridiales bacterium]
MKIGFSTLACPKWSWRDICSTAKDFGFDGIEVRGLGNDIFAVKAPPFSEQALPETIRDLDAKRLVIACFSSNCSLKYADRVKENIEEITGYIELASKTGTPFIRILADEKVNAEGDVDDSLVSRQLKELARVAEAKAVTLLVETNGVYADTSRLHRLLEEVASDSVAALWDMHHPYRIFGESPALTVENLGAYIKHVHVKDSAIMDGKISYKLMGEGDMPFDEMFRALQSINFDGMVCLEWTKRWSDELEDGGVALPHFADFMSRYTGKSMLRSQLYSNRSGTGKYIWERESLIDFTFPQLLDRVAEEFPNQQAFRYTEMTKWDYTRTYSEFRDDVDAFSRALISLGVRRGDKVAIWATNVPQWYITFWAATKIGAILVTVNTGYKVHEAEYLLRQSDTHTLVMIDGYRDSNYVGIIKEICPELAAHEAGRPLHAKRLPFLRNVISIESRQSGCLAWKEAEAFAQATPIEAVYQRMAMIKRHDVCNIQYTSGTTGFPKGVMLTHYNVVNNGKNIGDRMDFSTADRLMVQVPMFHCFGMVLAMTAAVTHGVTMCPIPAFSPKVSLDCINREKITAFHGVPTMFIALLEHEDFEKTDFSSMRSGIMAGSPCPVKVMKEVIEKMRMTEITSVYGQTESSPGCTQSSVSDSLEVKVNTVGRPLPGIECAIADPETGEFLPDNVDGEFVARGYNIMKGYYKMPSATESVIDKNGWLHTGDLARRLPDGNFMITGRIRDMIIRGGENIYPKEIEDFIYTHPKVKDVQVIGVPDRRYGEAIMACVVLKSGESATEDEVRRYVESHMAKHKTPKYVRFVDSFPMNGAGKILKYKMVEDAKQYLGISESGER